MYTIPPAFQVIVCMQCGPTGGAVSQKRRRQGKYTAQHEKSRQSEEFQRKGRVLRPVFQGRQFLSELWKRYTYRHKILSQRLSFFRIRSYIFLLTFSLFCGLLCVGGKSHDTQKKKAEYSYVPDWRRLSGRGHLLYAGGTIMHILEELYIGNVRPGERSFKRNSQYARALAAVAYSRFPRPAGS